MMTLDTILITNGRFRNELNSRMIVYTMVFHLRAAVRIRDIHMQVLVVSNIHFGAFHVADEWIE